MGDAVASPYKQREGRAWPSRARRSLLRHSTRGPRADARALDLGQPGDAVRLRERDALRLQGPCRVRPPGLDPRLADAGAPRLERLPRAPGGQRPDGKRRALRLPRAPPPPGRHRPRGYLVAALLQLAARPPADGAHRRALGPLLPGRRRHGGGPAAAELGRAVADGRCPDRDEPLRAARRLRLRDRLRLHPAWSGPRDLLPSRGPGAGEARGRRGGALRRALRQPEPAPEAATATARRVRALRRGPAGCAPAPAHRPGRRVRPLAHVLVRRA